MQVQLSLINNFINKSKNLNKPQKLSFRGNQDVIQKNITINGEQTQAIVYTNNIDYKALNKIGELCNHPVFKDAPIRIMPDVHAGTNCVVGFSAPVLAEKVIPNIIGSDIGCGVLCVKFNTVGKDIDFKKLDKVIKDYASSKSQYPKKLSKVPIEFIKEFEDLSVHKYKSKNNKTMRSLGTLGGGNHFIEIDKAGDDEYYLVIHSGSRNFGHEVSNYFNRMARKQNPYKNIELSFLEGPEAKEYLNDMQNAIKFSHYNRRLIADEIINKMGWREESSFESIHNYISDDGMIRKGAISAKKDEAVIIPLNMKDGCILGIGKGNADWNETAPHGAGRKYKRSEARQYIPFEIYKKSMEGIYSSSITPLHVDESPQAYKDSADIIDEIENTVEIEDFIFPVFNYKD